MVSRAWPASTPSPAATWMAETVPDRWAVTMVFIFMASMVATLSPSFTAWPWDTWISTTTPPRGLSLSSGLASRPADLLAAAGAAVRLGLQGAVQADALVTGLAQDARRRIAASVTEHREVDFDQPDPVEIRQEIARVVTGFEPDGGGIRLLAERIDGNRRIGDGLVVAKTELGVTHRSPP